MANIEIHKENKPAFLLEDNHQYENRFEIKSETSNRIYIIAKNKKTSVWSCSCPGWIIHRKCKHLTAGADLIRRLDEWNEKEVKSIK